MNSTFKSFQKAVEGHLLQVNAGYMTLKPFIVAYEEIGNEYIKSSEFWNEYNISYAQAL